ncbi:hypothetical protein ACTMQS_10510 [Pseudomonas syringae pv. aptata]|uniref:hypothetical protein n=1 Tax=Pseudomonas syringae TaxID=317 RepID=UPI003F8CBEAD
MQQLEDMIDELFDENPILKLPFPYIYNQFCQIVTHSLLDTKEVPFSTLIPYAFIFNKVTSFTNHTLESCTEAMYEIKPEDFKHLFACANLNIVFPFIRHEIYSLTQNSETESYIDYTSKNAETHELNDIIVTQLSLPAIPPLKRSPKTLIENIRHRLIRGESMEPLGYRDYIAAMYTNPENTFIEADIVPDDFYTHIGFSSAEVFKNIRNAFVCIGQTYIDVSILVNTYLATNEIYESPLGNKLWQGLAMAKFKSSELKDYIQDLTKSSDENYEKFSEFFFCGAGENTELHNKFIPPFWRIEDEIYFCPAIVPTLLGARNLLISIQNNKIKSKKYKYDKMISKLFEPALLRRAKSHFEAHGFETALEKDFEGGEIDLLAYCKKSHSVITIQAKATLYAESARMALRLGDRVVEGIDQTIRFDMLDKDSKEALYKRAFPGIKKPEEVNHLRAILTNSGFGTTSSWEKLEEHNITPINCNILRNILPHCGSLSDLPQKVSQFIQKAKAEIEFDETTKVFDLPGHTIYQRHVEPLGMKKLYDAQYWGE